MIQNMEAGMGVPKRIEECQTCRGGIRKAKAQMYLNLARQKKKNPNKNEFYRYTGQKKLSKDSVPPMVNE